MNKQEIINALATKTELTKKDSEIFLNAFEDVVIDELVNGGKVQIVGFGSFEVVERAERLGRNPKTGKEISIPAKKAPKFKAGKAFKEAVNE